MLKYDKVKGSKTEFSISHVKMEPSTSPDKTGETIRWYKDKLGNSKWIGKIGRIFAVPLIEDGDVFDMCASKDINVAALRSFKEVCEDERLKKVISSTQSFHRDAVQH